MNDLAISNLPLFRVATLSQEVLEEMRCLFDQVYQGDGSFASDLAEKDWVLLLRDEQQLVGFSTLLRRSMVFEGNPLVIFFSGDTVTQKSHRNRFDLPQLWARSVFQLVEREQDPCYWFLISSGFRTYRFLPIFYREFFPRYDRPTPPPLQRLMDHLGRNYFPEEYDPQRGIVRLSTPCREPLPARRLDAHAQFFLERNPGWEQGHELVCLTRLSPENQSPALQRLLRS